MSSNIPQKKHSSGIPKPPSRSASSASITTSIGGSHRAAISRPQAAQQSKRPEPSASVAAPPKQVAPMPPPPPPEWVELESKYKNDIETLTESAEMATIEKEIAEEKLDTCERELQELKDKLAEATLQIDMLKGQQQADQTMNAGNSESAVTVFQLQKVEEQNELLKQALIKLRDISTKDKQTLENLQIEHEELQEKMLDLEEKEHKYLEQIKIFEEQIDISHSAQEIVEKLTQQKTELEDKLKEMVEEIDGMEKLRDIDEQLLESARENEIELTGELDLLRVQYSELNKRKRDIEDYLNDQERTLTRLKDENHQLNDQIALLKNQFKEGESLEQQKHQIENVAYKLNFSETKMAEKEAEITRYKRNLAEMEEQMNSLSMITKEQSARLDELKLQYETKVSENSELQRALKKKMEEVSELEIRREMAEKKLHALQRDTETKIINLNRTIETMKGMEVQHEEDIKRLMEDNEIIERERRELRDQLNKSNRSLERSMQTGTQSISMMTAQDTSLASLGISFQTSPQVQASSLHMPQSHNQSINAQSTHVTSSSSPIGPARHVNIDSGVDDSIFLAKIRELSTAFDQVNRKNYELEMELAMRELNNGVPPYNESKLASYYDIDRAKALQAQAQKLKREVRAAIINQQICTKSRNINSLTRSDQFNNSRLGLKYQILENETTSLMSNSSLARMRPRAPLLQSTPVK